jgi:GNAT superfamily N-acetyltransferase
MRRHAYGSRELGSLVVDPPFRAQGIAVRVVTQLLAMHEGSGCT